MNLTTVGQLASAVQSVVVTVGVLAGGSWALYQFSAKKEADAAAAALAKAETELRVMERQLKGDASLDIEVSTSQVCSDEPTRYFIDSRVVLSNRGTRSAILDLTASRKSGLFAVNTSIQPNGITVFNGTYQPKLFAFDPASPTQPTDRNVLDMQPGVTSKLRYWIPVPSPGLYIVFFTAPMSKSDREVAQERLRREGSTLSPETWQWSARDYIVIKTGVCEAKRVTPILQGLLQRQSVN